jgi:hypothetical protein
MSGWASDADCSLIRTEEQARGGLGWAASRLNSRNTKTRPRGEEGFHVQLGRFDVPFGNDWQFFASKDSVSISRPLTTDGIMDGGYNNVGLRVLGNNGTVRFL